MKWQSTACWPTGETFSNVVGIQPPAKFANTGGNKTESTFANIQPAYLQNTKEINTNKKLV